LPCHVEAPCRPDIDPPICAPHVKSCAQRLASGASRCAVYSPYSIHRAQRVTFAFTPCPRQSSSCCPTCSLTSGQAGSAGRRDHLALCGASAALARAAESDSGSRAGTPGWSREQLRARHSRSGSAAVSRPRWHRSGAGRRRDVLASCAYYGGFHSQMLRVRISSRPAQSSWSDSKVRYPLASTETR